MVIPHVIDGQVYQDATEPCIPVNDPSLGTVCAEVPIASSKTYTLAITAAKRAFYTWSQTTAQKRATILFQFRALLLQHEDELANIVTREAGKTTEDAKGSVRRAIELIEYCCGWVNHSQSTLTHQASTDLDCYTIRQPLGVCVGISPFNFPVMVPVWMMIPAIASGNTFILKPSEQDPSASVRLAELLKEAGLPDGVVNVVHGDKAVVDALITHPEVAAVTAVASTPVAEHIYMQAIGTHKRAHTFGGAKNHAVLMPDADLATASKAIVGAAFGSAGERCMALSVVVAVEEQTADAFLEKLLPLMRDIRVGPGTDVHTDMGPLISRAHRERVIRCIDQGEQEGAKFCMDGRAFKHAEHPEGFYVGPTCFDHVKPNMQIYQQEIFGPVLCVMRVASFDEAVDLVNANPYGNGTAIFTQSGLYARAYVQRIEVGMVGVNVPIPVPIVSHPFGGWKRSAFGDVPMHGVENIYFYTKLKTVTSKWPQVLSGASAFVMPTHE